MVALSLGGGQSACYYHEHHTRFHTWLKHTTVKCFPAILNCIQAWAIAWWKFCKHLRQMLAPTPLAKLFLICLPFPTYRLRSICTTNPQHPSAFPSLLGIASTNTLEIESSLRQAASYIWIIGRALALKLKNLRWARTMKRNRQTFHSRARRYIRKRPRNLSITHNFYYHLKLIF